MYENKPIIGLAGGIGSGKSFVGAIFADLGCAVIASDKLVAAAYTHPAVKRTLGEWYGERVFDARGGVDRRAVADLVFRDAAQRERIEKLLHPVVGEARVALMRSAAADPAVAAYVWDSPLLFETKLNEACDAVIFVHAPYELRLERVRASRGWSKGELDRREKLQMSLDIKRDRADDSVENAADGESTRVQVRRLLDDILARTRAGEVPPAPVA